MNKTPLLLSIAITLSACSSTQEFKIVQTGADNYSIVKTETGYPGVGVLQDKITKAAESFCTTSHKRLNILMVHETQPPFSGSKQPRAEIRFKCTSS